VALRRQQVMEWIGVLIIIKALLDGLMLVPVTGARRRMGVTTTTMMMMMHTSSRVRQCPPVRVARFLARSLHSLRSVV